ncbi:hypothetical protein BU14_0014s0078 [Porphyra umbilicalis]|uniref:Uncharacterized protein n=1 Tax=Porphyra umbilicalis TaxID=2786 RepID=A0A1X6PLB4_PORUM|nr:hypothetical protein BU14_0014s0078 [Porphyra umbilicalis]|eukprot:OSX81528.1 hypothetical protein BU14_0014s0078 [Porphyra umbilicalis]
MVALVGVWGGLAAAAIGVWMAGRGLTTVDLHAGGGGRGCGGGAASAWRGVGGVARQLGARVWAPPGAVGGARTPGDGPTRRVEGGVTAGGGGGVPRHAPTAPPAGRRVPTRHRERELRPAHAANAAGPGGYPRAWRPVHHVDRARPATRGRGAALGTAWVPAGSPGGGAQRRRVWARGGLARHWAAGGRIAGGDAPAARARKRIKRAVRAWTRPRASLARRHRDRAPVAGRPRVTPGTRRSWCSRRRRAAAGHAITAHSQQATRVPAGTLFALSAPLARYRRSPKNPALQQLQQSSTLASTTPPRARSRSSVHCSDNNCHLLLSPHILQHRHTKTTRLWASAIRHASVACHVVTWGHARCPTSGAPYSLPPHRARHRCGWMSAMHDRGGRRRRRRCRHRCGCHHRQPVAAAADAEVPPTRPHPPCDGSAHAAGAPTGPLRSRCGASATRWAASMAAATGATEVAAVEMTAATVLAVGAASVVVAAASAVLVATGTLTLTVVTTGGTSTTVATVTAGNGEPTAATGNAGGPRRGGCLRATPPTANGAATCGGRKAVGGAATRGRTTTAVAAPPTAIGATAAAAGRLRPPPAAALAPAVFTPAAAPRRCTAGASPPPETASPPKPPPCRPRRPTSATTAATSPPARRQSSASASRTMRRCGTWRLSPPPPPPLLPAATRPSRQRAYRPTRGGRQRRPGRRYGGEARGEASARVPRRAFETRWAGSSVGARAAGGR